MRKMKVAFVVRPTLRERRFALHCAHKGRKPHEMSRMSNSPKGETFTFRLDPALKAALAGSAADAHMQPAELMRALVRAHLAGKERRVFEAEARRQSLAIARRTRDLDSDEARVMREIDVNLDGFADARKA